MDPPPKKLGEDA
ncbi:531dae62-90e5-44d8-a13f-75bd8009cff3 [Thermothielavioides terrestris]|uniref:531dae62-90e5-44d8-a13f-75bd8009cff3 n=1 Tax=Thermothielavioides terrestris TaxID=2587410 RepID=A0A446BD99_9PEZI|nr:531dae62-90e5-44d8-a13f-75bd8009cff3 [Thermothielavioides terrestris]